MLNSPSSDDSWAIPLYVLEVATIAIGFIMAIAVLLMN